MIDANRTNGGNLLVNGKKGTAHLQYTTIYCPHNGECEIKCASQSASYQACRRLEVHSQPTTTSLSIISVKSGNGILGYMTVYCPPSNGITPRCIIQSNYGYYADQLEYTNIYAIEGLNDVSITCSRGGHPISTLCYDVNVENPTIHCTEDYSQNCLLELSPSSNTNWNCKAGGNTICNDYSLHPTAAPSGLLIIIIIHSLMCTLQNRCFARECDAFHSADFIQKAQPQYTFFLFNIQRHQPQHRRLVMN